jgi:hypothetical protein
MLPSGPQARLCFATIGNLEGSMPFDGQNAALTIPDSLQAALIESGIEAVKPHVLDAHKAEELRRHPASWFYRRRGALQIARLVLLISILVAVLALGSVEHPLMGFLLALALLGAVVAQSTIPVRGPAVWRERAIDDLDAVHPAVWVSARRLQERLPQVSFRLAELIQDRVTLDPYLIAEYGNEQAVLGIWDGDRLIKPALQ